jgi:hypothetical protein
MEDEVTSVDEVAVRLKVDAVTVDSLDGRFRGTGIGRRGRAAPQTQSQNLVQDQATSSGRARAGSLDLFGKLGRWAGRTDVADCPLRAMGSAV